MKIWRRSIPGKGNSYCEGQKVDTRGDEEQKRASVAGAERVGEGWEMRSERRAGARLHRAIQGGVKHLGFIQPWEASEGVSECVHMCMSACVCGGGGRKGRRWRAEVIRFMFLKDRCGSCV